MKSSVAQIPFLELSLLAGSLVIGASSFLVEGVWAATGQRSIEVKETSGSVTSGSNPAKPGNRLQASGGLNSGFGGSAVLALDDGIGTVRVSENSNVQVKTLGTGAGGSKQTRLYLSQGQLSSKIRPFTNPRSTFEIETPGGVAGVRGTEFGVTVGPDGKTGLSTTAGKVAFTAKGQTVLVEPGFSAFIVPGQPPTKPKATTNNTQLKLQLLPATGDSQVRVTGTVDPINLVTLNNQVINTGREGRIDSVVPIPANRQLRVVVRTPLGNQQVYELEVPNNMGAPANPSS